MTRKNIFLVFYIISFIFVYAQETTVMGFDYSQFKSYFSDTHYDSTLGLELPRNAFTKPLYITGSIDEKVYAVGVVRNNNGDDLFIIHRVIKQQDLEYSSVVVFRDRQLLSKDFSETIIENAPDSDGGIFNQFYEIENSIIKTNIFWSECCASSGYDIPVAVKARINFFIDTTGSPSVASVDTCLFSSQFFDLSYVSSIKKTDTKYPVIDNPYHLKINNWTKKIEHLYSIGIRLFFYIDMTGNQPQVKFISKNSKGDILDIYTLSKDRHRKTITTISDSKDSLFLSPVIIKTSDGDIRLLPNGQFF